MIKCNRMLEAGEDPLYVAIRITRFTSEDVGLAAPYALEIAVCRLRVLHPTQSVQSEEVESGVFCIAKHVDLFIADEQGSPILSVYVKKYKNRVCA